MPFDGFGFSVDLSGNTLVVGAPYKDNNTGAAYAFVRSGTGWTQEARLSAPGIRVGDYYGLEVGIHDDTVAVGAPIEGSDYGAVYVFGRAKTGWDAPLRLTPSDPLPDKFGLSLAVAERAVVVGAYAWPGPGTPNDTPARPTCTSGHQPRPSSRRTWLRSSIRASRTARSSESAPERRPAIASGSSGTSLRPRVTSSPRTSPPLRAAIS